MSGGLEMRDYSTGDSAFVQVATAPAGKPPAAALLVADIFKADGKYGAYGPPYDVKLRSDQVVDDDSGGTLRLLDIAFTALTPGQRTVDRRCFVALPDGPPIGGSAFMLVSGALATRYKAAAPELRKVALSFSASRAPDTALRPKARG